MATAIAPHSVWSGVLRRVNIEQHWAASVPGITNTLEQQSDEAVSGD